MREIRTSGSVRGEGGNLLAYSTPGAAKKDPVPYVPIFRRRR